MWTCCWMLLSCAGGEAFRPLGVSSSVSSSVHEFRGRHSQRLFALDSPDLPHPHEPVDVGLLDALRDAASISPEDVGNLKAALFNSLPTAAVPSLPDLPDVGLSDILRGAASISPEDVVNLRAALVNSLLDGVFGEVVSSIADQVPLEVVSPLFQQTMDELDKYVALVGQAFDDNPSLPFIVFVVSTVIIQSLVNPFPVPSKPYPNERYDAESAKAYFDRRPVQSLTRLLQLLSKSLSFGLKVFQDWRTQDSSKDNERGMELAELLTQLGPTYIKVGQSLSIRTDLLSPGYIRGLATLQDQVPSFDSKVAFAMIEEQWGRPLKDVVSEISPEPVAAASLGQVYKATLKDENNTEVAIKVQRPDIREQIALDMHLLREYIAKTAKKLGNLNTDTVGTVDAWGLGFVDELDYIQEAQNAKFFTEQIEQTPLKDVVFSPKVVDELSTSSVLVSEWVDGERLDRSAKRDVTVLCSIAMNTYLTMLLEVGLLHCDPHPGNLLRTPDGRLCILDWGMVTRLDEDLQLTLIEHMAHLTSADYAEIPRDLLLLGFIPESKADLIEDSGVVDVLAEIYGTWTKGGGVAAFNVNEVIAKLQDLTATKGNLFQIPPYFAYIAKSFSVLEGIGLSFDAKYSIVNECLPYVSQRLLTDNENMGPALSTFIFGPTKNSADRLVDYDRIEQLVTGFGSYATSTSGALLGKEDVSRRQLIEDAADQILGIVFSEKETPVQAIMVEQLAKITAASGRSVWTQIREQSGALPGGRSLLGTLIDPVGFWRTSPLVQMDDQDRKTVETTRKLIDLMVVQIQETVEMNPAFDLRNLSPEEVLELSTVLIQKLWSKRSGVLMTGNRFAQELLQLTADALEAGRETQRLAATSKEESKIPSAEEEQVSEPLGASMSTVKDTKPLGRTSDRLIGARRRLVDLEEEYNAVSNEAVVTEV